MIDEYKSTFKIIFIGLLTYFFQKSYFFVTHSSDNDFELSLEKTYLFMIIASAIIMIILNMVFKKNKDIVGMTFLLITSVKAIIFTIVAKTLHITAQNSIEKWNFFGLFVFFLFLETYFTGVRLNKTKF